MFRTARAVALAASCAGLLLAGCSTKPQAVHNGMIDKDTLSQGIVDWFHQHMGDNTISVSCPEPLKAEVGQSETCSDVDYLLHGHVLATITAIHNGNPEYKLMVVDD
jgi:hypothetical protein